VAVIDPKENYHLSEVLNLTGSQQCKTVLPVLHRPLREFHIDNDSFEEEGCSAGIKNSIAPNTKVVVNTGARLLNRYLKAVIALTCWLCMSAQAGLVEVNTSQYMRESSPSARTLEVTLENEDEIRISNINFQNADMRFSYLSQAY
tara:strand:- start:403 stop:840 length:438 start_codon:yes stop_codon:yes gene_type:complete